MIRVRHPDSSPASFLYFFDSFVGLFQSPSEELWGYVVWHGGLEEARYKYTNKPFYQHQEQALRSAKLHVLMNMVARSRQLHWLTLYPTDRIFIQSEAAIATFGSAKDTLVKNFFPNPQDRIDLIQHVRGKGKAEAHLVVQNLDGHAYSGKVVVNHIPLDKETHLLLELFVPDEILQIPH